MARPSRLLRGDLLDSERVHKQPLEARWLFVTMLLNADDIGLQELNHFKLGRDAGLDQTKIGVLLQLLADADLIRPYRVDEKEYAFIPRYRQRLNATRFKHPLPPYALYADDEHAFKQINDLAKKSPGIPVAPRESPLEVEVEPLKEKEPLTGFSSSAAQNADPPIAAKPTEERQPEDWLPEEFRAPAPPPPPPYRVPDCPYATLLDLFHHRLPMLPTLIKLTEGRREMARARWVQICSEEKYDVAAGLEWFDDFYRMVAASAFLTGKAKAFKASWEWLHKASNFIKIIEGNYADNRVRA